MQLHRGDPVRSAHRHHVGSVIDGRVRPSTQERGGWAPVTLVSVRRHHDDVGMLRRQPDGAETGRQCLPVGIVTHPHLLAQLEPPAVQLQHRRRIGVRIDVLPEPRDVGLRMRFSDRDERPHHLRRHDHRGPHRHRCTPGRAGTSPNASSAEPARWRGSWSWRPGRPVRRRSRGTGGRGRQPTSAPPPRARAPLPRATDLSRAVRRAPSRWHGCSRDRTGRTRARADRARCPVGLARPSRRGAPKGTSSVSERSTIDVSRC